MGESRCEFRSEFRLSGTHSSKDSIVCDKINWCGKVIISDIYFRLPPLVRLWPKRKLDKEAPGLILGGVNVLIFLIWSG